jgi:predicted metalloendopeptidase
MYQYLRNEKKKLFAGRQFDKDGNLMQWWNNATIQAFRERAQCIVDQYSQYKLENVDLYVNGRMTQGENIADNGGLKQSYRVNNLITFELHSKKCFKGRNKLF